MEAGLNGDSKAERILEKTFTAFCLGVRTIKDEMRRNWGSLTPEISEKGGRGRPLGLEESIEESRKGKLWQA